MDKRTHNQVRQVLMNELGLTRNSIREEMKDIIEKTAASHVNRLMEEGGMKEILREALNELVKANGYDRDPVGNILREEVKKRAAEYVRDSVVFHVRGETGLPPARPGYEWVELPAKGERL